MRKITKSKEFLKIEKRALEYKIGGVWGLAYRFLIIICQLLDRDNITKRKKQRKINAWSMFAGEYLKHGKSLKEASRDWKNRKK